MSRRESDEIFRRVASYAEGAPEVRCRPLRSNPYVQDSRSTVALVRTDNRIPGIEEALRLIGGLDPALGTVDGYVLVKPNCNSDDPFPASVHPDTLRVVLRRLLETGLSKDQIVVGDMSGPNWLPTQKTMQLNGTLDAANEFDVKVSFFEDEDWVTVKPEKATTWPDGFRLAKTVHEASRIISLACLKTHQFGGVFSLSLKNGVGVINPMDRSYLHRSPKMRDLIAEVNLGYSADLVLLDGMKCFVTGGPATGDVVSSGVMIAGGDRVAVDAVGICILKFYKATGIAGVAVKKQEQLRRAVEIGLGQIDLERMELKISNLAGDKEFPKLVHFIENELRI